MSEGWKIFVVMLVCMCIIFATLIAGSQYAKVKHSAFDEPGVCPTCGAKLVKGVYGESTPHFIWYCPDCP
jgi:hypothetical protein